MHGAHYYFVDKHGFVSDIEQHHMLEHTQIGGAPQLHPGLTAVLTPRLLSRHFQALSSVETEL